MTKPEIHIGTAKDMADRAIDAWKRAERGEDVDEEHVTLPPGSLNKVGKAWENVFDALDMPYEAAVTRIWQLGSPGINPDFEAFKKAVDIIRKVVEADRAQRAKASYADFKNAYGTEGK